MKSSAVYLFALIATVSGMSAAEDDTVSQIPSGTSTPYIPAVTTSDGTQVGVSVNVDTSRDGATVDGGGIAVSTPVTPNTSVGGGVSTTPSGNAVGVGLKTTF